MKKFITGFIIGFLISSAAVYADIISAPPPINDVNVYHYLRQIYENFHRLQVMTSTPNGTRTGKKGDMILLQTGGNSYLEINTDSSTTWKGVILTETP